MKRIREATGRLWLGGSLTSYIQRTHCMLLLDERSALGCVVLGGNNLMIACSSVEEDAQRARATDEPAHSNLYMLTDMTGERLVSVEEESRKEGPMFADRSGANGWRSVKTQRSLSSIQRSYWEASPLYCGTPGNLIVGVIQTPGAAASVPSRSSGLYQNEFPSTIQLFVDRDGWRYFGLSGPSRTKHFARGKRLPLRSIVSVFFDPTGPRLAVGVNGVCSEFIVLEPLLSAESRWFPFFCVYAGLAAIQVNNNWKYEQLASQFLAGDDNALKSLSSKDLFNED